MGPRYGPCSIMVGSDPWGVVWYAVYGMSLVCIGVHIRGPC